MSGELLDPTPLDTDLDGDLVAEGLGDVMASLRAYAGTAPGARAVLTTRVLAAIAAEAEAPSRREANSVATVSLLSRLTFGLRPAAFRPVLAAATLILVLGAGVALAAAGALPFDLPTFGGPGDIRVDPHAPVIPGDEDADQDEDVDADDASPDPSEDVEGDQDQDPDEDEDSDSDEDEDSDSDEDSEDEDSDSDEDTGDEEDSEDEDSEDEDSDSDEDTGDEEDSEDEDSDSDEDAGVEADEDDGDADTGDRDANETPDEGVNEDESEDQ